MKISVIDVGSNSVRLMVMADGKTLYKRLDTTRLGEGLATSGVLKPEAIERTARAVQILRLRQNSAARARRTFLQPLRCARRQTAPTSSPA